MSKLLCGAGRAEVAFTDAMFPTIGENYVGVHDRPLVQAVLLQGASGFALLSVGIVIMDCKNELLAVAENELGIPGDHILLHATHTLATPHIRRWANVRDWEEDPMHKRMSVSEGEAMLYMQRDNLMVQAYEDAVREACRLAKQTLQPAKMGFSEAKAAVTVNRVVETQNGWWQGVNQDGPAEHRVPVLRFESEKGEPIAILYNCNVAPGCMEFSEVNGGRLVSGDLAAASERFVDAAYSDEVVSAYLTGFTGDQWQALRARKDYLTRDGKQVVEDLGMAGFALMDVLATRLGEQVVKAADSIQSFDSKIEPKLDWFEFTYTGQKTSCGFGGGEPTKKCEYYEDGEQKAEIAILQLGETAVVACGVELCYETAEKIRQESPFKHTLILEFTTNGGGYLPEAVFYDRVSFQSRKSRYIKGTAERFAEDVLHSLREAKKKYVSKEDSLSRE